MSSIRWISQFVSSSIQGPSKVDIVIHDGRLCEHLQSNIHPWALIANVLQDITEIMALERAAACPRYYRVVAKCRKLDKPHS